MAWKVIVVKPYTREFEIPLVAPEGTILEVLRRNDGLYTDWFVCRSRQGIEAYVPDELLEIDGRDGKLLADYSSWELTVQKGEILERLQSMGGWIWARTSEGEYGWVPSINVKDYSNK